ncbi:MAG: DUF3301 domain-containing protein [Arenicellales bacterium WSBS_2016_MAG_OTU3]
MDLLLTLCAAAVIWWKMKGVKDKAVVVCKDYCKKIDVQMLDESVVLRALWYKRNDYGKLKLWRKYAFEFSSTGEQRYRGMLVMLGGVVELIEVEPHRLH